MLSAVATTTAVLLPSNYKERKRQRDDATSKVPPRPIEIRSDEVLNGVVGLIGVYALTSFDTYFSMIIWDASTLIREHSSRTYQFAE